MTTEIDPITEKVPTAVKDHRAPRKKRTNRHPAAASRILAAGLATASTFGLVAVVGNRAQAADAQAAEAASSAFEASLAAPNSTAAPTTAPPPVVVIRRTYVQVDGVTQPSSGSSSSATSSPSASAQRSAPVTAAPRRTAPATRSSSS